MFFRKKLAKKIAEVNLSDFFLTSAIFSQHQDKCMSLTSSVRAFVERREQDFEGEAVGGGQGAAEAES